MARLGELLVAARLLDAEQIQCALRAQVVWGGRLGTNLVELGLLDLDGLTRALGRQHGVPAALARHFDKADRELQERLPPELAQKWSVVPLLHVGGKKQIAIAALEPLPVAALAELADAFLCPPAGIIVSVAAEMRVRYHLERVYQVARRSRFLRSRGKSVTPFPQFDNVPVPVDSDEEVAVPIAVDDSRHPTAAVDLEPTPPPAPPPEPAPPPANVDDLAALIDEAIAQATAHEPTVPVGRDRRTYVRTLDPTPPPPVRTPVPREAPLGRIAIRRVAIEKDATRTVPTSFVDATRAIPRGSHRDLVARHAIETLQQFVPACSAAMLLVIRGDVATGWKHFSRAGDPAEEIAVPLEEPGLVPTVIEHNATARAGGDDLHAIDEALMRSLGAPQGDLVVVPIAIADRVMCVIAAATESDADAAAIEAVAMAAAAAFARLIRDASR